MLRCACRACPLCGRQLQPTVGPGEQGTMHLCGLVEDRHANGCGAAWGHLSMHGAAELVALGAEWEIDGDLVDVFIAGTERQRVAIHPMIG